MANRKILEQEIDEFDRALGKYNAEFAAYDAQFDPLRAGKRTVIKGDDGSYYVAQGIKDDGQIDFSVYPKSGRQRTWEAARDAIEVSAPEGDGKLLEHVRDPNWNPTPGQTNTFWDPSARKNTQAYYLGPVPEAPADPGLKPPTFTRAEQRTLATPDLTAAQVERQAGKTTVQRTGAGQWSPFAASNAGEGILMRALKNKL